MHSYRFKSNIQCGNCLSKVTPVLNAEAGINKWEVDLNHADRILTVETNSLAQDDIKAAVRKAGFKAEELA